MASQSKSIKESKKKKGRPYQQLPQPLNLSSRAEIAKEKLRNTHEYDTLRPSQLSQLASNFTDKATLHELFETPQDGGGASASAGAGGRAGRVSVKLFLARQQHDDRQHTFTGSVAMPNSIELRFEQFCSYGINAEAALLVGDQYFKWTPNSLVIPRGMKIRDDSLGAQPHSLGDERPTDLGGTDKLDQLLDVVAEYNGMHYYHPISRNSKIFVRDALQRLSKPVHHLLQVFDNYHQKIKGQQTLGIQDGFRNHEELDQYYRRTDHATIVRNKRNIEYLFFLCVCFHVLGKAADGSGAAQQWTCNERDCCLPFLHSNLTEENLIFNDFWRLFMQ